MLVRRGDEPIRETRLAVDAERARDTADGIIVELFPHACSSAVRLLGGDGKRKEVAVTAP